MLRNDRGFAMLAHLITVGAGIKKDTGQGFTRDDFTPFESPDDIPDTVANVAAMMKANR